MQAYRWIPGATTLTPCVVPIPTPKDDEVLVKVLASGMCHTDLLFLGPNPPVPDLKPTTMGHEGAGVIVKLGTRVQDLYPDLHENLYVAIHARNPCFLDTCTACSAGADNICNTYYPIGVGVDGCYAPYVAVRAQIVVPVHSDLATFPPEQAAVATDAVLTPWHALKTVAGVTPGHTVLILGIGGLGSNAVQIAKNCLDAKYVIAVAVDERESSNATAMSLGADFAMKPNALSEFVKGRNIVIDVACDMVGIPETFSLATSVTRPRGTVIVVGMTAPKVDFFVHEAVAKELTVRGSSWGTKRELQEVIDAMLQGKITPLVHRRPMSAAVDAFEEMRRHKVVGRVVVLADDISASSERSRL
ncbi:alcohol dehydogenase [Fistulina hepatica ATCC 64428]|uniref:Alcohol dehydogenase n=1 Tax=Fistulina hepatica ATCC 64428 TaxID=1128425 RepID=A0A0D7AMX5_9AGAR|nr:alcohol dehydogenase [Fistulina hepatica ATCC 64428]